MAYSRFVGRVVAHVQHLYRRSSDVAGLWRHAWKLADHCCQHNHAGAIGHGAGSESDLAHLLSAATVDEDSVGLLRDGTEALVRVLSMVMGVGGVNMDEPVQ